MIPKLVCRRCRRMEWSTVLKAAEKSRRIRAAESPQSTAWMMSDSTSRTAVSVEWPVRNTDYNSGRRSADVRYFISWLTPRRSRSFDSTDRFEIGRYELVSVAWSPGFFTTGVTNERFFKDSMKVTFG